MTPEDVSRFAHRVLGLKDSFWLFILGVNNSGTTILSRILEAHPTVRSLPREGQELTDAFPLPWRHGVTRLWSQRPDIFHWTEEQDGLPALVAVHSWSRHFNGSGGILLEKSPPNTLRCRWLQHWFRPSRFIAIVRSPFAVAEGIRRRGFGTIEQGARHWLAANRTLLQDSQHLQHGLMLRYEDLCADPPGQLMKVQRFLELPGPLPHESIAGMRVENKNPRSWNNLSHDERLTIEKIAAPLMHELGYQGLRD